MKVKRCEESIKNLERVVPVCTVHPKVSSLKEKDTDVVVLTRTYCMFRGSISQYYYHVEILSPTVHVNMHCLNLVYLSTLQLMFVDADGNIYWGTAM